MDELMRPSPAAVTTVPVSADPVASVEELTAEWLSTALGRRIDRVVAAQVGSGQIGSCHRLTLHGEAGTERMIAKLGAADATARAMLAGAYRTESRFYAELAEGLSIRIPDCRLATEVDDDGHVVILLEEAVRAEQGDQVAGCTPGQARAAAVNLAGLHAPRWCDPALLELGWINPAGEDDTALLTELAGPTVSAFLDQVGHLLSAEARSTLTELPSLFGPWLKARTERFALVHGDYRLDNLMFSTVDEEVVAVDWQTLSIGLPARDLAYLLGTGLAPADRRTHERGIVEAWHAALVRLGVDGYTLAEAWDDYRFAMVQGPLVTVFGCAYGTRTERGDQMFAAMAERSCAAIRELGTLELVG
ncbi:hypothetical protein BJ980_000238 [Nocardioides daedukensis]|uniref:CHK kinase-like domain-containing protein n=1 Tax=Nocardioides daedukensis TaxID=634462 RepID=A0A7Y9UVI1_9ACTN|nr:phosphotransferase [Nocardioides daedukensis]NYG57315.1 hypothetical protein [Nocardioides daedukensis]